MRSSILCRVIALSALICSSNGYAPVPVAGTGYPRTSTQIGMKSDGAMEPMFGRRKALQTLLGGAAFVSSSGAYALDMDSFMNSEVRMHILTIVLVCLQELTAHAMKCTRTSILFTSNRTYV